MTVSKLRPGARRLCGAFAAAAVLAPGAGAADEVLERVAQRKVSEFILAAQEGSLEAEVALRCYSAGGWSEIYICIRRELAVANALENLPAPASASPDGAETPSGPKPPCAYQWTRQWFSDLRTAAWFSGRVANHEHFSSIYLELWDRGQLLDDGRDSLGPNGTFKIFVTSPRTIRASLQPRFKCE